MQNVQQMLTLIVPIWEAVTRGCQGGAQNAPAGAGGLWRREIWGWHLALTSALISFFLTPLHSTCILGANSTLSIPNHRHLSLGLGRKLYPQDAHTQGSHHTCSLVLEHSWQVRPRGLWTSLLHGGPCKVRLLASQSSQTRSSLGGVGDLLRL